MVGRPFIHSVDNSQCPVLSAMSKLRSISRLSLISGRPHLDSVLETDDNQSAAHLYAGYSKVLYYEFISLLNLLYD